MAGLIGRASGHVQSAATGGMSFAWNGAFYVVICPWSSRDKRHMRIAIAGAGVASLAAGAALARAGRDVTIFDRFDAPRPIGSGLVIQPVGQAVLATLGALDQAATRGQFITRLVGSEARGERRVLDVQYDPGGRRGTQGLAIHRAALFDVLLQAARDAGATLVPAHEVTGLSGDVRRRLRFADGRESTPFDLVIDASGAGSPLTPLRPRALPYGAIWGTVPWPADTALPATRLTQRYVRARHMLGVLPVGLVPGKTGPRAAIFWSLPRRDLAAWQAAPLEDWKAGAATVWPEFAPFLRTVTTHADMTPAFYSHGTLHRPARPGLIHIGDAAHQASPQLGQGANMALLDAQALSIALRQVPDNLPAALAACHRLRRRHLVIYQVLSRMLTPMYQSDSRALPLLRDHVLTPVSRLGLVQVLLSRLVCGDLVSPIRGGGP